ncbi:MAG: hypothetical protein AAFU85_22180 [Planctomycetota bacterium]
MATASHDRSIDAALIARVTREVIARLRGNPADGADSPAIELEPALDAQMRRRGVVLPASTKLLWTDEPARAVYEQCRGGRRAVMVTAFSDVERFAQELDPDVWVLDRKRINLVAAVNAAARIAQLAAGGSR